MSKKDNIKYDIDKFVIVNYVDAINSIEESMTQIKKILNKYKEENTISDEYFYNFYKFKKDTYKEQLRNIIRMVEEVHDITEKYYKKQKEKEIYINIIIEMMKKNNGIITTRMIEPLNISRQYLSIMENEKIIERISRGIYLYVDAFEDSYFTFQQKYKKIIFSHMNALYFYGMTEEFPYNYTVTVPYKYHMSSVNEKCNVFYVNEDIYNLGVVEVETPSGNKVKTYDKERCICDIVRSQGRMDPEQVKKTIKLYIESDDKDLLKLYEYSKKMKINKKVMQMIGS